MFRELEKGRPALLVAMSVAVLLIAAPTAHGAATTIDVSGTTGTIVLNGDNDTVVVTNVGGNLSHGLTGAACLEVPNGCNSAIDWDTGAAGDQTLPAGATAEVVINGDDGRDTLTGPTVASDVLRVTFDGGAGNDLLTGSRGPDLLRGDAGNDRVVGFVGNDDMDGGTENDTLVWNNGDGSDSMDGDGGNDGVEVNGAQVAGDTFTIQPGAGGRTDFDRTNLGPFSLDILAERLEVNGAGGDDSMTASGALASLILLRLDGGSGVDTITGADGPDLILGGEENDPLTGGAGDDRIVGDRGGDTMNAGLGDDTMVWNNGDGSDIMNGEGGRDVVEVNGSPTGADTFTVEPNGARIKFDRTSAGAFNLDIGTAEAMALNSLGGDDTVTVGEVGVFFVLAQGGPGNDSLNGGGGAETFLGGSGNDTMTPGTGLDVVYGADGDDVIAVRDGFVDFTRCGEGNDLVTADEVALDGAVEGCETVNRPAVVDDSTIPATIRAGTVRIRNRRGRITVDCPAASPVNCRGTLTVFSAKAIKVGRFRLVIRLAKSSFNVAPGESARVVIRLPRGSAGLANRRGRLAARAEATTGASPATAKRTRRLTLNFGTP